MSLRITPQNLPLYSRVIEVYEDAGTTRIAGNQVYLDDKPLNEYTFEMDYYWMMGDNRHNSEDSRYWGFVPEDHIVGKPLFVLISIEGGVRWSRIFMGID
jgi:signal peptidase I